MTRKYQEGGQLTDTQQQGLQYLALMYAQQTGKDPQQDLEGFMQFVLQLAQQAGVQDIGQLLDMIYQQAQGQAQAARRGAKLNYLKRLTGKCPEGYELQYFRAGGRVCSQCVAKKKVLKESCGKKIKKNCGGKKINSNQSGGQFVQRVKNALSGFKNWMDITEHRLGNVGTTTTKNGVDRVIWTNDAGVPVDTTYIHPFYGNDTSKKIYNGEETPVLKIKKRVLNTTGFKLLKGGKSRQKKSSFGGNKTNVSLWPLNNRYWEDYENPQPLIHNFSENYGNANVNEVGYSVPTGQGTGYTVERSIWNYPVNKADTAYSVTLSSPSTYYHSDALPESLYNPVRNLKYKMFKNLFDSTRTLLSPRGGGAR